MSVLQIKRGDGALPVYRQVSDALRHDIQNYYQSGDALPSESELALRYQVNRHTLRRAVDELVVAGLVVRHHGKGVFVLSPAIDYQIGTRTRFTETLETQGMTTQSRVIRKQRLPAQGGVAKRLELPVGKDAIFIETLREVEGQPFCLISHFLPFEQFEDVFESYDGGSLHEFIEEHCGIQLQRAESLISSVIPETDDCHRLQMPRFMPVLRVKSVNVDMQNRQAVEYVITRFRGDAAQLAILPT